MAAVCVLSGVDTLETTHYVSIGEDLAEQLDGLKAEAAARALDADRDPEPVRVRIDDGTVDENGHRGTKLAKVGPKGSKGWRWWLECNDWRIQICRVSEWATEKRRRAGVIVRWNQSAIHRDGIEECVRRAEAIVSRLGRTPDPSGEICRIDLFADVAGWHLGRDDTERWVTRARKRSRRYVPAIEVMDDVEEKTSGTRFSGWTFSGRGSGCYLRIYDKTEHCGIYQKKAWMRDRWIDVGRAPEAFRGFYDAQTGEPVELAQRPERWPQIWRIEFEMHREWLKTTRVPRLLDDGRWVDHVAMLHTRHIEPMRAPLWRYLTEDWIAHRLTEQATRRERAPLSPEWAIVQKAHNAEPDRCSGRLYRERYTDPECLALLKQAMGCVNSAAAVAGAGVKQTGEPRTDEEILLWALGELRSATGKRDLAADRAIDEEANRWTELPAAPTHPQ